jgi:hypothetical protein
VDLTVDLRVGRLSGEVKVNGATMPDSPPPAHGTDPDERGFLVLTGAYGDTYTLPLGRAGPARFSALVFAGTYQADLRTASDAELSGLPHGVVAHLSDALVVGGELLTDFDVPLVGVSGSLTRNGQTWPDSGASRGTVAFTDARSGSRYTFDVGATGAAHYAGQVLGGTYDIAFVGGADDAPLPAYAPCSLERGRSITSAVTQDYDVKAAGVHGTVTLNGGALPDSPMLPAGASRGAIVFSDLATLETFAFDVGATDAGTWSGTLPTGTFSVSFASASQANLVGLPASKTQVLSGALQVSAPAQLDFDLTVADVSGAITLAGQPLPDSPALGPTGSRGSVAFVQRLTGEQSYFSVGATGSALYSGRVFAGDYDVAFSAAPGAVGLPEFRAALLELGAHVAQSRTTDYDVHVTDLTVSIALDGGELGDGGVEIADLATGFIFDLPPGPDAGMFSAQLFSGSYDLRLLLGARGQRVLAQQAALGPGAVPLSYEVPFFDVTGTLTLNGQPLREGPRGSLTLRERLTRWPVPVPLASTGPAQFHGKVMEGLYDLHLLTDVDGPSLGLPASVEAQIATGCAR